MLTLAVEPKPEKFTPASGEKGLLRFITAGSVDDGKSTLIGRLLFDAQSVYEDQLLSIQKSKVNRADGPIDFSLLTDGLRAEREQGITIDVAYRYFSTSKRKFIIADTPGHEQYTRNMVTGASTADAAVILIDARKGLLTQSRRHTYIASLLGIQHVVGAINKMDLVEYRKEVFAEIAQEFENLARHLGIRHAYVVPISALKGDGVVSFSGRTPWFSGPPLLEYLENLPARVEEQSQPLRLPIQCVIRPNSHFRGFAGQIASGQLKRGATVIALPSRIQTRVKSISRFDSELPEAGSGASITVTLEDEIDLSRGDMLVEEARLPKITNRFAANLVWLHSDLSRSGEDYLLKHTSRIVRARLQQIVHRVDVNTFEFLPASTLQMNDIGHAVVETRQALFFDPYRQNRATGSFILIDPISNATVAAGMIEGSTARDSSSDVPVAVPLIEADGSVALKPSRSEKVSAAVWISGRQSLAETLERTILHEGWKAQLISTLEFSQTELKAIAKILYRTGVIAIISVPGEEPELRQAIATIFGLRFMFVPEYSSSDSNSESVSAVMAWLRSMDEQQRRENHHA
jgi:sulfate adenylyltransferase large subunit